MIPLISVVVCTYNRSDILKGCLQSLIEQEAADNIYEIVVINNNSTDNTQGIINVFVQSHPMIRTFSEPKQGLSHARNRGWQEARGKYVAYIDDDAKAYPNWVSAMHSFIQKHSEVSVFGGPYDAFSSRRVPEWFPSDYGSLNFGNEECVINMKTSLITGTNMVFKKELLQKMGGFNTRLGMRGNSISYGEEVRLLLDVNKSGSPIYYVPSLRVQHLIAEYKMSLRWLLLSRYSAGRCSALALNKSRSIHSILYAIVKNLLKAPLKLFVLRRMPLKRRIYNSLSELFIQSGALVEYFKDAGDIQ